jgi:hypothetical protein
VSSGWVTDACTFSNNCAEQAIRMIKIKTKVAAGSEP